MHARRFALSTLTLAALVAVGSAAAQNAAGTRVEITGSSIKRIDGESALPVQTIRREDINKLGVTTAAELLQKTTSNVGGLTDGASITDQSGAQRGFNGVNLRGLGVSSTLVLLNGRRLANFANLISRATFQLSENHQLFAEALFSKTETDYAASPATSGNIAASVGGTLPLSLQAVTGITTPVALRFRLSDAGNRTSRVESEATRLLPGATGNLAGWDYDAALNRSVNKATDENLSGWVSNSRMRAGLASGAYNSFVPQTAAGKAFMESIQLSGAARVAEGTTTIPDGKVSKALARLDGGDMVLAVGL